jgi:hypothetical protein
MYEEVLNNFNRLIPYALTGIKFTHDNGMIDCEAADSQL